MVTAWGLIKYNNKFTFTQREVKNRKTMLMDRLYKNKWSYTSTPSHVVTAWGLIKYSNKFTFTQREAKNRKAVLMDRLYLTFVQNQ